MIFKRNPAYIPNSLIKSLLNSLPLLYDEEESKDTATYLVRIINDKNPNMFGENDCNGPEIYSALLRIQEYFRQKEQRTGKVDEEFMSKIGALSVNDS